MSPKSKPWSRAEVIQLVYRSPREPEAALAARLGRSLSEIQAKYAEWRTRELTGLAYIDEHSEGEPSE